MKESKDTIINQMPILLENMTFFAIKTFMTQWIFIQSFKIDMFWKPEKTEKYSQSFFILWMKLKYRKNALTCKN